MTHRFLIRPREPASALSHLPAIPLSVAALVTLVCLSHGDVWKITSFAIYGGSLVILYIASTLYHLLPVEPAVVDRLRRFDQCAIYALIAGCYTPLCLVTLRGPWGWALLAIVWAIAVAGIAGQCAWPRMPCRLHVIAYVAMGWLMFFWIRPIAQHLGPHGLLWLIGGGCFYAAGAVVFATERPRLWPGKFGFHDLWHLFVLAGSTAHFMMMTVILHASG